MGCDLSAVLRILSANILLRVLASLFSGDVGLQFSFFVVSLPGFGIRIMLASKNDLETPPLEIFGIV